MKVAVPLAKCFLAPLGPLAIDAGIQRKIDGSETTTIIISYKKMNDILKIDKKGHTDRDKEKENERKK